VALVVESGGQGHFRQREARIEHHLPRFSNPVLHLELVRREADASFELSEQMEPADVQSFREGFEIKGLLRMKEQPLLHRTDEITLPAARLPHRR